MVSDHFEALFNKKYLRWFHLQDYPALVEITNVGREEMTLPGGEESTEPVLHLKLIEGKVENIKPLVLNWTNAQSVAEIHGESWPGWVGKRVVLYQSTARVGKKTKKCIRIRAPKEQKDEHDPPTKK